MMNIHPPWRLTVTPATAWPSTIRVMISFRYFARFDSLSFSTHNFTTLHRDVESRPLVPVTISTVTKFALIAYLHLSGVRIRVSGSSNPGLDSGFLWTCSRGLPVECRPAYLCTVTLQVCIVHVCHPPNIFHRPKDFLRQVHESWSLCFKVLIIDNVLCIPDRSSHFGCSSAVIGSKNHGSHRAKGLWNPRLISISSWQVTTTTTRGGDEIKY